MSASSTPASPTQQPSLTNLPCPHCGKNLLAEGFYNSCTETSRVHEENRSSWCETICTWTTMRKPSTR
jgi:hypothetical protein